MKLKPLKKNCQYKCNDCKVASKCPCRRRGADIDIDSKFDDLLENIF